MEEENMDNEEMSEEEPEDEVEEKSNEEELSLIPSLELKDKEIKEERAQIVKEENKKDLIWEMRMLLTNYPIRINFREGEDSISVINNILLIYDLLNYCNNKSKTKEIKDKIELELKEFQYKLNLKELRKLYRIHIETKTKFGSHNIKNKIDNMLNDNSEFIYSKLQYYILAIPMKSKQMTHYKTGHGLPAYSAEEFESEQIEEGGKVSDGQTFKIEEGRVIPLE